MTRDDMELYYRLLGYLSTEKCNGAAWGCCADYPCVPCSVKAKVAELDAAREARKAKTVTP